MADNYGVLDNNGVLRTISAKEETTNVYSNRVTPRIGGADVASGNPLPVATQSTDPIVTSLGTDGTTPPTLPGGSTGVRGWLRYLASLLPALVSGRWPVDGSGVTQPVSAASLPLPTGAATSAAQTTGNTSLASIDGKIPALVTGRVPVDGSAVTQPVSLASAPLPTGASTSALQTTGNTSLASIDTKTPALVTGRVPVDGSAVTQPVSASALPLPTGAATSALQTTGNTSLGSIDTKTPALVSGRVPVDPSGVTQPVSGAVTPAAGTASGATPYSLISTGTSGDATNVKASAGTIYGYQIINKSTTSAAWVKLYDSATAPTAGSGTPKKRLCIPAAVSSTQPTVVVSGPAVGVAFTTGIGFTIVTGSADNSSTGVASGDVTLNIDYK